MTDKKIKPTNPNTEKKADADHAKGVERKTAAARFKGRVSGRKTSASRGKL